MENSTINILSKRTAPKGRLKYKPLDCSAECAYYKISNREELCKYNNSWARLLSKRENKNCTYKNKKTLANNLIK